MNDHIFFTDEGKGFPVVFIHGFCETHEMWDDFKKPFLEHYRVITIDLPGFGLSSSLREGFSIADVANRILKLFGDLSLDKAVVIAHSLGGYVTLEMVKKDPAMFAGFSLFHSTAFEDDSDKKDSRNKTIDFVNKRGVEVFATSFVPSLFFQENRKNLKSEIEKAVGIAARTSLDTLVSYTEAMRDRNDRTDVLESFENPILFIAGDKDTSVPVEKTSEQVLLPKRAIVNILQDTGHMGMFEEKDKTTEIISDFLKLVAG